MPSKCRDQARVLWPGLPEPDLAILTARRETRDRCRAARGERQGAD